MKKLSGGLIALIVVIAIVVVGALSFFSAYNSIVTSRETVDQSEAAINTQLQRRVDLIPNLVNTVKGFAAHETEIINSVTTARAQMAGAQNMQDKANADAALTNALSRLLVVVENYPQLKTDTTFVGLMDELAGTENRIAVARNDYNGAVKNYNSMIIRFPANIIAGMFGFVKGQYLSPVPIGKVSILT
jgi:LemA protein